MRISYLLLGLLVVAMIFMRPAIESFTGFSEPSLNDQLSGNVHVIDLPAYIPTEEEINEQEIETTDEQLQEIESFEEAFPEEKENPFVEEDLKNYQPPAE